MDIAPHMTERWEQGTRVQTPDGSIGTVVITSYRSNIFSHPGEVYIPTVDVLFDDTGQVITYRADKLQPIVRTTPPPSPE